MSAPPCHCTPSTPWADRRDDGAWDLAGETLYMRTCMTCGASLSSLTLVLKPIAKARPFVVVAATRKVSS